MPTLPYQTPELYTLEQPRLYVKQPLDTKTKEEEEKNENENEKKKKNV